MRDFRASVIAVLLAATAGQAVVDRAAAQEHFPRVGDRPRAAAPAAPPAAAKSADRKPAENRPEERRRESKDEKKDPDLVKATEPMKFVRVRSAAPNCGANCPEWISAEGRIMTGVTLSQLKRAVLGLGDKKVPIFIHSAGGSVEEAYAMGRFIRSKGLAVSVTKTDLQECGRDDKDCRALAAKGIRLGSPKPPMSVCASSCVFVLAGGVERHVGPYSLVGVHQYESRVTQIQVLQKYRMVPHPRTGEMVKEVISEERVSSKTIKLKTASEVYDKSEVYFRELGVTAAIMVPLRATPHQSMHWLSPSEITQTKIATDRRTGTQLVNLVPPSAEIDRKRLDLALQMQANASAAAAAEVKRTSDCTLSPLVCQAMKPSPAPAVPKTAAPAVITHTLPAGPTEVHAPKAEIDRARIEMARQLQANAAAAAAATSASTQAPPPVEHRDPALVRAIQVQLKAGNCLDGPIVGIWGERSRRAVAKFAAATGRTVDPGRTDTTLLDTIRTAVAARSKVCDSPED